MTDSKTTTERPYCEGHYRLLSVRCWRCKIRDGCRFMTAFNAYADERWNKDGR